MADPSPKVTNAIGTSDVPAPVGVVGLGVMGEPMASNLVAAGIDVIVSSRSPGPVERLAEQGAQTASTAREVASACRVVLVVVAETADMATVLDGNDGLIAGAHDGLIVIDCGSHDPAAMPDFAERLHRHGAEFLDAPLSGGQVGARDGTLSIMVGGSEATLRAARPVLEIVGDTIVHLGDVGSGQVAKACNQLVVAANLEALAEAVALARAAGLDPSRLLEVLAGGLAAGRVIELSGPRMVEGDFAPGGKARFHLRDLRITRSLMEAHGLDLPALEMVIDAFERLVESGRGDLDHSALVTLVDGVMDQSRPPRTQ